MQGVERVKEFFLGPFLLRQELNIVDTQHVNVTKFVAEAAHAVIAQGIDHLVGKFLTRDIADRNLGLPPFDLMSDGLHQMGFPHPHAAIQKQRVIGFGRSLGNGLGGGVRELIS